MALFDYSIGASVTVLGGLVDRRGLRRRRWPGGAAWDGITDDTVVGTLELRLLSQRIQPPPEEAARRRRRGPLRSQRK